MEEQEPKLPLTFEERMKRKSEVEAAQEKERIERERAEYLKRTGRTEMKP